MEFSTEAWFLFVWQEVSLFRLSPAVILKRAR
jgi:hypothetical protein